MFTRPGNCLYAFAHFRPKTGIRDWPMPTSQLDEARDIGHAFAHLSANCPQALIFHGGKKKVGTGFVHKKDPQNAPLRMVKFSMGVSENG